MTAPLYDAATKYNPRGRFHTPAHFANPSLGPLYFCSGYDITELPFSDNLTNPDGVILEAEKAAAAAYRTDDALFLTQGGTGAIQIALLATGARRVLILGDAHRAVYEAVRLFDMTAFKTEEYNSPKALERAIDEYAADVVFVTSPNYFGVTQKLKEIKQITSLKNIPLIVDAAHGSHFIYCSKLPVSATEYGDLVIHSCHKTMPVFTGGAILNCNKRYAMRARFFRSALHTTSPNYTVLASLDYARELYEKDGEALYAELQAKLEAFIDDAKKLRFDFYHNDDPTHLILDVDGFDTADLEAELNLRGIYPEMRDDTKVLFLVTPFNQNKLPELLDALSSITLIPAEQEALPPKPAEGVPVIFKQPFKLVPLAESLGCTLYREVGLYPPGTPLYYQGELLTREIVEFLKSKQSRLFGLVNGCVCVL